MIVYIQPDDLPVVLSKKARAYEVYAIARQRDTKWGKGGCRFVGPPRSVVVPTGQVVVVPEKGRGQ